MGCPLFAQSVHLDTDPDIDSILRSGIQSFRIKTPRLIYNTDKKQYEFGKKLFSDNKLSLEKNISCMSCHDPKFGTSDGLPFSIGTGGIGLGPKRLQNGAAITPRSAPHLYNKGNPAFKTMFWDGRVSYNTSTQTYKTPDPGLNGDYPKYYNITDTIESVMAMQAIFPIASVEEMRGKRFANLSNIEVWNRVAASIKDDPSYKTYTKGLENFNIGHIGNALSYFQKIEFQVRNTPFDRYMQGTASTLTTSALTTVEKRGALLFVGKARCARCHNGPLLSNLAFQVVAVPQIGPGFTRDRNDEGRFLANGNERFKYAFLTQPLRNIALTAPFMHNGALKDLNAVVNHYNNPSRSIDNYSVGLVQSLYGKNYESFIYVEKNQYRNFYRKNALAPILKSPLGLTAREIKDLVCFLKKSLTEERHHDKISLKECL